MTDPTYMFMREDPDNFRSYYFNRRGKIFCIWGYSRSHGPEPRFYECTAEGEPLWPVPLFPQDREFDRKVMP